MGLRPMVLALARAIGCSAERRIHWAGYSFENEDNGPPSKPDDDTYRKSSTSSKMQCLMMVNRTDSFRFDIRRVLKNPRHPALSVQERGRRLVKTIAVRIAALARV